MANANVNREDLLALLQKGTYDGTKGELMDYSLYDTWTLATGDTKYDYFTVPLNASGKNYSHTNFKLNGQMPLGHAFQVTDIAVYLRLESQIGTGTGLISESDLNNFLFKTVVSFEISGKESLGIWKLCELMGQSTLYDTAESFFTSRNVFSGKRKLQVPIVIASLTPFKVSAVNYETSGVQSALNDSDLTISLNGILVRAS
jgi:hypothetical protein